MKYNFNVYHVIFIFYDLFFNVLKYFVFSKVDTKIIATISVLVSDTQDKYLI